MAPSSSVKGAAKKTGVSKKVVVRSNKKKAGADAPKMVPKLPPDWPVTSHPPTYPTTASALRPGSLLQEKCSGQDIHLARSAAASTSIDKEKGKLLLIFPGQMSFHKTPSSTMPSSQQDPANSLKTPSKTDADDNQVKEEDEPFPSQKKTKSSQDNDDDDEYSDDEALSLEDNAKEAKSASKPAPASTAKKTTSVPPASLGNLEGLRTETPVFKIPFPQMNKTLVFPGKKVPSTSKFIMLSCANKQKMAVQCKSIFSSAVVFGAPKWETMEGSKVKMTMAADGDGDKADRGATEMAHYGGSFRTTDGATRGQKTLASQEEPQIPIVRKKGSSDDAFGFPGLEKFATSVTKERKTTVNEQNDADDLHNYDDEDDSSASDFSLELTLPKKAASASASKARAAPKRQASLNRKSYAAEEEVDDDDSHESSDESDVKEVPPPSNRAKVAKPQSKKRAPPPRNQAKPAKAQTSKKELIEIESSGDEDRDVEEVPPPTKRAKVRKEQSSKKRSSGESKPVSKGASTAKPRPGRSAAATAKKKVTDLLNSDGDAVESSEDESDEIVAPKKAAAKKSDKRKSEAVKIKSKRSRKKAPSVTSSEKTKKTTNATPQTPDAKTTSVESETPVSVTQPSPEPSKSPFRRRRKQSSGKKLGFSPKNAFDLTADDEFDFS